MKTAGISLSIFGGFVALIGLLWVVVYYASLAQLPIAALENWNILIGAGFFFTGAMAGVVGIVLLATGKRH